MKDSKYKSLFILVIILLVGLIGTSGYIVYEKLFKPNNDAFNDFVIIDNSKTCAEALEKIYEDNDNEYFLPCIKSAYVFIKFSNGQSENIKDALENKDVTIEDIIAKDYHVIVKSKIR